MAQPYAIFFSAEIGSTPEPIAGWLAGRALAVLRADSGEALMGMALRGRPTVVIFDARDAGAPAALEACRQLKGDAYSGVVPAAVLAGFGSAALRAAFEAGGDEVCTPDMPEDLVTLRLDAMMRRAERDMQVHPSTRLPGAPEIEAQLARRLTEGSRFAVCYADLDHFKEYNDRYSYFEGDRVIRMLARILHDAVRGLVPEGGFVGHIGGDDFIFIVPLASYPEVCAEVVAVFDLLAPYQYSEQDRRAGYFFGKDRRGQLHRVPLMTVSIGVVTNEHRQFAHPAQVSELATEMKSYAKTLPGSVFAADRRHDMSPAAALCGGGSERDA